METTTDRIGELADLMRRCVSVHCVNRDGSGCELGQKDLDEIAACLGILHSVTRDLDRRGVVLDAALSWMRYQDPIYDDMARRDGARNLRDVLHGYTRETLRQSEHVSASQ